MTTDWTRRFGDDAWPLLGRDAELARALAFLAPDDNAAPSCQLDIAGISGLGKSLFTKALICEFAAYNDNAICLYVNVNENEFESAELEKALLQLVSRARRPTRAEPQNVPRDAVPPAVPAAKRRDPDGWLWDFLLEEAQARPVLLAIDNVQFLPRSVQAELERLIPPVDRGVRLVLVERLLTPRDPHEHGPVICFPFRCYAATLEPLTPAQTREVVAEIWDDPDSVDELSDGLYTTSQGNPKQLWLQLRTAYFNRDSEFDVAGGIYEATIDTLPELGKLALRVVTLLEGGLKLDDLVAFLRTMTLPDAEDKIRKMIAALALIGLLIINGVAQDRVRPEHELVKVTVRQATSEQETLRLRRDTLSALSDRLRSYGAPDEEYDRLVDGLIGLLTPADIEHDPYHRAHVIRLIERQQKQENNHYLTTFYPQWVELAAALPRECLLAILDALQKTSQFDRGIDAVRTMRNSASNLSPADLALAEAKFLVQQFHYERAMALLDTATPGSERDLLRFNILLNWCENDRARAIVDELVASGRELDEFEYVMLRNSSHLYDAPTARKLLLRARAGFERLGRRLAAATTSTNLGVVDVWDGDYASAERHLTQARSELSQLGSNEVYQPLTNLAVLNALQGRYASAADLLSKAEGIVARRQLVMDDLLLQFDRLVIEVMAGTFDLDAAAYEARLIHRRSVEKTQDYAFSETVGWFANELARVTGKSPVAPAVDPRVGDGCSGLDAVKNVIVQGCAFTAVLVLSPHWRY